MISRAFWQAAVQTNQRKSRRGHSTLFLGPLTPPQPYARAGRRDSEWQWAAVKMPNVHPYARPASKQRRALSANLTDDTRQLNVRALIHSEMLPRANTNGAWSLSILLVDRWWPRDFIASPRGASRCSRDRPSSLASLSASSTELAAAFYFFLAIRIWRLVING